MMHLNKRGDIVMSENCEKNCKFCCTKVENLNVSFGKDKIISISSTPQWNEEAKAAGITRIVPKDYMNLNDFKIRLISEINNIQGDYE